MEDFVTLETYDDYLKASFDRQKLEDNGLDCYLADENTVAIQWTLMNAVGGIKLRVPGHQVEEAIKILSEKTGEIIADFQLEEKQDDVICPACGSNNTGTEKFSRSIAGWSWLILGFPITATAKKQHRCFHCGHRWSR